MSLSFFGKETLEILRLILVLALKQPAGDDSARPADLREYLDCRSVAFLEADLVEARRTVAGMPELKRAVGLAGDPEFAAERLAERIGTDPARVRMIFSGLRGAAFWLVGVGHDQPRFLLVLDRTGAPALPGVMELLVALAEGSRGGRRGGTPPTDLPESKLSYLGQSLYRFPVSGRRSAAWLAEVDGKLAVGSDMAVMQSFVRCAAAKPAGRPHAAAEKKTIVRGEVDCSLALNSLLAAARRSERDEIATIASFADVSSWKKLEFAATAGTLEAALDLGAPNRLSGLLQPPSEPSALLALLPRKTGLAGAIRLKDASPIWELIADGVAAINVAEGQAPDRQKIVEEARREMGIDPKALFAQLTEAALILPKIGNIRRFDPGETLVFAFRCRDAASGRGLAVDFLKKVGFIDDDTKTAKVKDAEVWIPDGGHWKAALSGRTFVIGSAEGDPPPFDEVLKNIGTASSSAGETLVKRYPNALGCLVFDPSVLLGGGDAGMLTAGLSFSGDTVKLRADLDVAAFATAAGNVLERVATEEGALRCRANLKRVAELAAAYLGSHGQYPSNLEAMIENAKGKEPDALRCPVSREPYIYNAKLAGVKVGVIADRAKVVLAYDASPAHGARTCAVFLDGNTVSVGADELKALLAEPGPAGER